MLLNRVQRCCTHAYLHICFCLGRSGYHGRASCGLYTAHHSNNHLTTHNCPCHHAAHEKEYPQTCPQAFLPHPPPSWQVQGMLGDPAATCASVHRLQSHSHTGLQAQHLAVWFAFIVKRSCPVLHVSCVELQTVHKPCCQ